MSFSALDERNLDHISLGDINFPTILTNNGDGFDGQKFIAPKSGIFRFHFSCLSRNSKDFLKISVWKNDEQMFRFEDQNKKSFTSLTYVWSLKMNQGDTTHLEVISGSIVVGDHGGKIWINWSGNIIP